MNEKISYRSREGVYSNLLRKIRLSLFLLCVFLLPAIAGSVPDGNDNALQQLSIKGKVIDSETLTGFPGVNIVVKGTTIATMTNIDGEFSLNVPDSKATLTFSFIGYVPQDVSVRGLSIVNVTLVSDLQVLQEVVVIGFGTAKKEVLTAAISNIKSDALLTTTHSSLMQGLQGKLSGLQIRQNSGEPGNFDESINIKGFGTPLYIIDGIARGSGSDLGAQGKVKFRLNSVFGTQAPTNVVEMANASQFMDILNDADINFGKAPFISADELAKYHDGTYSNTDWYNETFNSAAVIQQHTFSAEGGNENISYFTSFGYQNEGSLLKSKDMFYKKYTFRSNITTKFTKDLVANIDVAGPAIRVDI